MDIYIGATRETLHRELLAVLTQIELVPADSDVDVTLGAVNNMTGLGVTIHFNNDDMEGRPEVADKIVVDVVT